jgi:hypothetical protein
MGELVWLFFLISSLQPLLAQRWLAMKRIQALRTLERRNGSRAITLIHRREGFSFLGIPFGGFIDIDDSEAVIRAIEMTAPEVPIDLVGAHAGRAGPRSRADRVLAGSSPGPSYRLRTPLCDEWRTLIALAAERIVLSLSLHPRSAQRPLSQHEA